MKVEEEEEVVVFYFYLPYLLNLILMFYKNVQDSLEGLWLGLVLGLAVGISVRVRA